MINKIYKLFVILIDPISDPKTKSSSYINKMNFNANDDNGEDAKEIPSPNK